MREIILDTETTGFDPREGDRLVEVAAIEMVEKVLTGRHFHAYFNPDRDMPAVAEAVHGLSSEFLATKARFHESATALLEFVGDAPIVAHNAIFDWRFMVAELERAGRKPWPYDRFVDTLELARVRFPGAKHSLDALCTRFGIDRSGRTLHGALIDTHLLAEVYVELTGGRQIGMDLAVAAGDAAGAAAPAVARPQRLFSPRATERAAHARFVEAIESSMWRRARSR